ncbi:MAG: NAD(P)/FAD-dependent oxidoreductase [bacterium]|nr:NAD(P)/FAD-dependent oxidoreductase [bacterium]
MNQEIVIVGGGFSGARIAKILASASWRMAREIHITLIDKSRYHTYQPHLYEVATAHLPEAFGQGPLPLDFFDLKSSAIYPLEDIFTDDLNVTVLEDKVLSVDFKAREVILEKGKKHPYDILVLSAGSETNYFGNKGLMERGLPLKNFFDALEIRNAVDEAFANTPKNKQVKIIIGGGGFTGCELAGEMMGYFKKLEAIHGRPDGSFECIIVDASDKLLGGASPWVSKRAVKRLSSLGVKFKFQSPIKDVGDGEVILGTGEKIPYNVLIWTAGVKASDLSHELLGVKLEKASCVIVDKNLRIEPYENVFGAGDSTYCVDETTGKSLPMTASVALREAKCVAENIKRVILKKPLLKYKPHNSGVIAPLGGRFALLESNGVRLEGFIPWLVKMAVSLHYWATLIGWKKSWQIMKKGMKIYKQND